MIRFINRKKAKRLIKTIWCKHHDIREDALDKRGTEQLTYDISEFARAIAELSAMCGIFEVTPPDEWN